MLCTITCNRQSFVLRTITCNRRALRANIPSGVSFACEKPRIPLFVVRIRCEMKSTNLKHPVGNVRAVAIVAWLTVREGARLFQAMSATSLHVDYNILFTIEPFGLAKYYPLYRICYTFFAITILWTNYLSSNEQSSARTLLEARLASIE